MNDPDEPTEDTEKEHDMSTATATPAPPKNGTAAAKILESLGDTEGPLSVEQLSKLTDIKPATLERALRKMLGERQVVKTTVDDLAHYALPPATRTKGEIPVQVLAFLAAHPGEDFSPYKIAQAIERFPGSVAWTCQAMARRGELVQVGTKPVTYTLPD